MRSARLQFWRLSLSQTRADYVVYGQGMQEPRLQPRRGYLWQRMCTGSANLHSVHQPCPPSSCAPSPAPHLTRTQRLVDTVGRVRLPAQWQAAAAWRTGSARQGTAPVHGSHGPWPPLGAAAVHSAPRRRPSRHSTLCLLAPARAATSHPSVRRRPLLARGAGTGASASRHLHGALGGHASAMHRPLSELEPEMLPASPHGLVRWVAT